MGSPQIKSLPGWIDNKRDVLYLATHSAPVAAGVQAHLQTQGLPYTEPYDNLLAIRLSSGELFDLCEYFDDVLSRADIKRSMCLLISEGVEPSIHDMLQMQPLRALIRTVQGRWLTRMLQEMRLLSHFQPIVYTADPDRILAYECLSAVPTMMGR